MDVGKMTVAAVAFLAVCCAITASAAPVDEAMARKAIGAWRARGGVLGLKVGRTVRDVRRVEKDGAAFHVVRFEGGGMAISPTDTTIRPVIMFSEEDDFDENPGNPAWDLLVPELAARARQIASRKVKAAVQKSDCETEWEELLSDLKYDKVGDDAMDDIRVPSFVKTRWNQGSAGGGYCYNYYTPEHHVCGCVATAMAQAMRYLEYPASTTEVPKFTNRRCSFLGTRTAYTTQGGFYDWSKMPYVPSSGMPEEERQAIGKLTSDLGIMLGSDYGSSGTGAVPPAVQYVFTKCLGYANAISIEYDVGAWWGIDDEYTQMMMSNFDAKLPVVISLNGHEILGDGYGYRNGSLYYHLNFGWSGAAWYKPAKMEEGMEGYHVFYGAIFNIYTTRAGNPEIASGRVTDADGRPVKGLTVKAARASSPDEVVATAVTDDNGIYAAFVPPNDCYRISAEILYEDGKGHYFGTCDAKVGKSVSREVFVDTGLRTIGGVSTEFLLPHSLWHGSPACSIGNVAQCDIQLRGENFDPEATVSVGTVTVGRDFSEVVVPVTAKVVHYGQTATSAKVVVTLTPASGGTSLAKEFAIDGDLGSHGFSAVFTGLRAGTKYNVTASVTIGGAVVRSAAGTLTTGYPPPAATVSVGTAVAGKVYSEATVPVTAQVTEYGSATSAKVVVTLTPASGGTSLAKEFVIGGDLVSHGFSAVFTGLRAGTKYNVTASVTIGGTVVRSAAGTLTIGYPPPEATVSIGAVTVGRDFAVATVPVAAQVSEYGSATGAKVVVTLAPAGGGSKVTREFALGGDTAVHQFSAAFDGLTAGGRYDVTAKVVVGDSSGWNDDGKFAAADSFTWFDESATSFSAAKWTGAGETVAVRDGALAICNCWDSETTFTPEKKAVGASRIVFKVRESECYTAETIPKPDEPVAISAIVRSSEQAELVVWGGGKWNATGILFADDDANLDVVVDLDFRNHNVKYGVGGKTLGTYSLPSTVSTVSSVAFKGYAVLSEMAGTAEDANLVRDGDGNEYATFADAMSAGATGVLSPLWLSTWSLSGFSGVFDVRDPNGLITYAKGSQTVKTENLGGGIVRTWYAQLSDADILAGANKYLKTTAELGLVKAVTDGSVVKIGDYLVANGAMSFIVEIDDVAVAKEAVRKLVQVKSALSDEWRQPADDDIRFESGRVVVTPNRGGASGFARVKVPEG